MGSPGIGVLITSFLESFMGCVCFTNLVTIIPGKERRIRNGQSGRPGEVRGTNPRQELMVENLAPPLLGVEVNLGFSVKN